MGQTAAAGSDDADVSRAFTRSLLDDLRVLERMIKQGRIESGVRRFGAEQELFLVDDGWRPAPLALKVLERLSDGDFTTELALFNLEANVPPHLLEGECLSVLEEALDEMVRKVRAATRAEGGQVVLAGILPTLVKSDLGLENMTPRPRYHRLNEVISRLRGGAYRLRIEGTDELNLEHDTVMLEACNTSCQVHLQVSADEFARFYNVAQTMVAPALAASVNSPVLFGKRLWAETRIALFQQSLDTRSATLHLRELSPRVRFGEGWVNESVIELFQDDISRFRVIMAEEVAEDSFRVLDEGGVPRLPALQLHNGTVYRWNRPCYGISEGEPHLRIECRALPSGPTIRDEVANAAFWMGLVLGGGAEFGDIRERMEFDDAKANFLACSRLGLAAGVNWFGGETVGVRTLIQRDLLPLARTGLLEAGVASSDVDRYLGVIHDRVESGQTGSVWALRSLAAMRDHGTRAERLAAVTAATVARQEKGDPVHGWTLAELHEAGGWKQNYMRVEQYMNTTLYTVNEEELVEMVAFLMDREGVRHVLVEDDNHRLVGLVSYRSILRIVAEGGRRRGLESLPVREIMEAALATVTPETPTLDAIDLMRKERVSCLPVLKDGKLVGLVSERDFMPIAYQLLEERLREV
ncbi:MAG: glutamate-cysteine ligase family protein [Gemmatimonadota bacterium]